MKRKYLKSLLAVYAASTLLFAWGFQTEAQEKAYGVDVMDLAVLSLNAVYPGAGDGVTDSRDHEEAGADERGGQEIIPLKETAEPGPEPVIFGEEPVVLILHTHATETYLPASEGNYHSKERENSVRDVGAVLARSLEEEGIAVVHDETLHDSPSYSSSYSRSYAAAQAVLERYPTIRCIIDLHRDAIASDAAGAVVSVGGRTCANYMYVVSTAAATYEQNLGFIHALNEEAASSFSGFTGSVLERGYQYNQGLSDHYLLLEIGNNRNHISDARNTARIYGKILADVLKAGW